MEGIVPGVDEKVTILRGGSNTTDNKNNYLRREIDMAQPDPKDGTHIGVTAVTNYILMTLRVGIIIIRVVLNSAKNRH